MAGVRNMNVLIQRKKSQVFIKQAIKSGFFTILAQI